MKKSKYYQVGAVLSVAAASIILQALPAHANAAPAAQPASSNKGRCDALRQAMVNNDGNNGKQENLSMLAQMALYKSLGCDKEPNANSHYDELYKEKKTPWIKTLINGIKDELSKAHKAGLDPVKRDFARAEIQKIKDKYPNGYVENVTTGDLWTKQVRSTSWVTGTVCHSVAMQPSVCNDLATGQRLSNEETRKRHAELRAQASYLDQLYDMLARNS